VNHSLRGVNLAGAERAYVSNPARVEGQPYQRDSHQDIDYLRSKDVAVMLEPHGGEFSRGARDKGHAIGSAAVPHSAFADLWRGLGGLA